MIGLIIPDIVNNFYGVIVEYVRKEVESYGYFLLLGITGSNSANEEKYINEFITRGVDGVIYIPQLKHSDIRYVEQFDECKIPYLFLTARYEELDVPYVLCDLKKGFYEMTKHLLEQGLTEIYVMVGDKKVDQPYISGFYEACREFGICPDETVIVESSFEFEAIQEVADEIFFKGPQAIMTISDIMACGVMQQARKRGIRIPEELSVTGYDDVIYSIINHIPISTVMQPIKEMCVIAVNNLMNIMKYGIVPPSVILEPKLVLRETTRD
ncbi:Degradation activator [uncultured Blautia sp.]|nr:substrate-binding domain-containing protein [uncultured Blautia sp.]SCI93651.1 Degradation activator [uncultured Blautia sp.]